MQWPSKKETKGNRYEKNYSSKYQPLPRLENRLKTRKSQDQWDRYLNGVEDNAIRERGRECGTYSRGKGLKIVGSSA